jgi:2-desacetyl-2-hydroxyethyl bacteriochlorophyllide A dehydrogenase
MRAAVVERLPTRTLAVVDLDAPAPAPGELLVRVEACGICGTDLHILEGSSYRPRLPFVLGHEPVGRVVAAAESAGDEWLGRRVTLTLFEGCGRCRWCLSGDERVCPNLRSVRGVLNAAGGFAELMTVPAAQAVEVPEALSSIEAATLVDAGASAMNAAAVTAATGAEAALVVGGGPVGFLLAEILRGRGVDVAVAEPREERRSALEAHGHRVLASLDALGAPVPVVAECSGSPAVVAPALDVLEPRGTLVLVGYARLADLDAAPIARKELTVRGVRSGSKTHLETVVRLAADGAIRLPAAATWPIAEINAAFEALRAGRVVGKAVVVNTET